MEKDGMCVAGVRTPEEYQLGFFNFAIRTRPSARSEDRRQTGDAGGVSSAVATVNIVGADYRSNEFLRRVIQFVGGFRATEHAKSARAVSFNFCAEAFGDAIQRLIPACLAMLSILSNQWSGEPSLVHVCHGSPLVLTVFS
jgi:hypothetical protein